MKSHLCCQSFASGETNAQAFEQISGERAKRENAGFSRRFFGILRLALPVTMLALLPKCPLCFAAYFALFTGFGISLTTAGYLRFSLMILCSAAILHLALKFFGRAAISRLARPALIGRADH